jgi:predicted permease
VMMTKKRSMRWSVPRGALAALAQDLRYAARFLAGNPAFAAVVLGTLALGIGANTAIFSLADQALLRAPAVHDPASLVAVYTTSRRGFPRSSSSYPDYEDYRDRTAALADLAATTALPVSLGDEERGARLITIEAVTGNALTLLGVATPLGRAILPADEYEPVVVLSNALWRSLGSDPGIVGESVRLNDQPFEVIGVLAPEYRGLALGDEPDAWVPIRAAPPIGTGFAVARATVFEERASRWIGRLVGRLAPGATAEQAREQLLAVSEQLREEDPEARGPRSVTVDPLARYLLPLGSEESLRGFVALLSGVVGITLLLACANLANLLLARASTRRAEIGVRLAIGAGRRRLVRQLLTESLLLALVGGGAGLLVARGLMSVLASYQLPGGISIGALNAGVDVRVLVAALALSVATALLFGLVPAIQSTRPGVMDAVRSGRSPDRHGSTRLRSGLVAAQMTLCLILLVGSGLFLRTLHNALRADLGFRTEGVALARFNLGLAGYEGSDALAYASSLGDRLGAMPGVSSVALSTLIPFQGGGFMGTFFSVDGYDAAPDEELRVDMVFVTPGFFETLGIRLLDGRDFDASDGEGSAEVAIVSRAMAERYWPNGGATGGTIRIGASTVGVVGVAEDVQWRSLDGEITNFAFFPLAKSPSAAEGFLTAGVRTTDDPARLLPGMRSEIRLLDPDVSPSFVLTMDDLIGALLMPQRLGAVLLSAFGLLALVLAVVGIAGVVSYTVREQRRAIGVRVALGARRGQMHRLVLRGVAGPLILGLVVGLAVALALRDAVAGFLYEVPAGDPLTYVAVATGLVVVALGAAFVPAREAARVDPVQVLKAE